MSCGGQHAIKVKPMRHHYNVGLMVYIYCVCLQLYFSMNRHTSSCHMNHLRERESDLLQQLETDCLITCQPLTKPQNFCRLQAITRDSGILPLKMARSRLLVQEEAI